MTRSAHLAPFLTPFLVTLVAVGVPYALLMSQGFCTDANSCAAGAYFIGPVLLLAAAVTGFVAGRLSPWGPTAIGPVLVAAFAPPTVFVLVLQVAKAISQPQTNGPAAFVAEWEFGAFEWLKFTAVDVACVILGFLVGRGRREASARKRAVDRVADEVASLDARRDSGTMAAEDVQREQAALLGSLQAPDQAPPDHRCGRCGKSLSPAWRGKCKHCGARYADFPPVASERPAS
jgi:hypothetical protein